MRIFYKYFEISTTIFDLNTETFVFDDFRVSKYLGFEKNFFFEIVNQYSDNKSNIKFWNNKKKEKSKNAKYFVKIENRNKKKIFFLIEENYIEAKNLIITNIYNFHSYLKINSLISLSNRIISVKAITPCLFNPKNDVVKILKKSSGFWNLSEKNEISYEEFLKFFDAEFHIIVENLLKNKDRRYRKNILRGIDKNKNVHFLKIEYLKFLNNGSLYFTLIDITSFVSKENILADNIKDLMHQKSENNKKILIQNEKLEKNYEELQNLKHTIINFLKELKYTIVNQENNHSIDYFVIELENKIEKLQTDVLPDFSETFKMPNDFEKDRRKLFDTHGKVVILIAEDEEINYAYLELLVKKVVTNAEILHAKNGIEAVQIAQQNPIDLILMDLRMPGLDGISAATKIKHFKKEIPIIIVSAFEESENEDYSSIDEYINKPIDRSKIEKVINKYIKK